MSSDAVAKSPSISLEQAFEAEHARREAERQARLDAERKQQELDLANAQALYDRLSGETAFLAEKGLTLQMSATRFTVTLEHEEFRITAYFEGGNADVRSADKRNTSVPGASAPRKQQAVEGVDDALLVIAQYLADETR
ncbi:hypothetical protein [Phenylobacterium sp.]|uniref:hypothetical protein n=1 Tax=Phenylobacterium sp. TaxID=1871053 RepID=UPI0035B29E61